MNYYANLIDYSQFEIFVSPDTMRQTLQSSNQSSTASIPVNDIVSQSAEDATLLEAYRQQIASCIRSRLQQDPDFNPALYPNSQQKFK